MLFKFKYHFSFLLIPFFIILNACQLQEPNKTHGITFLKNRSEKLIINDSNKNDVLKVMGQPHSKSINNDDEWFYIERTLTKGAFHKLGQHVLKDNNILVLSFNKYGILNDKIFINKFDNKKIAFTEESTNNQMTQKSFVQKFLTSIKAKMYGNK